MSRVRTTTALIASALVAQASCSGDASLKPFSSDGCSLFPDSSLISGADWCDCCFEHDISYWKGGTEAERQTADLALRDCVANKTGNAKLANAMYEGVRLGGSPYFYNWYRWGYGWNYSRKYQPLTVAEQSRAQQLMETYIAESEQQVCAVGTAVEQ